MKAAHWPWSNRRLACHT